MSRPEHFENENKRLPGGNRTETTGSEPSRRRFIRNMAIGTAGAAITMGSLDRLHGASRLLKRLTNSHVEGFLENIKNVAETPQARAEFQRISALILEALDSDPKSRDTFNAIKHYLANPVVPIPQDAKHSDVGMLMGAGYLRAIGGLQQTTRHVSANDVKKRLQDPKNILHVFESGFLNELYFKTKEESASNPNFARRLDDANREVRGMVSHSKEAKLIPASLVQCPDCTITWPDGSIYCATWEECVGLVVVVVVIFLIIK